MTDTCKNQEVRDLKQKSKESAQVINGTIILEEKNSDFQTQYLFWT